jgi:hypothetical protein
VDRSGEGFDRSWQTLKIGAKVSFHAAHARIAEQRVELSWSLLAPLTKRLQHDVHADLVSVAKAIDDGLPPGRIRGRLLSRGGVLLCLRETLDPKTRRSE